MNSRLKHNWTVLLQTVRYVSSDLGQTQHCREQQTLQGFAKIEMEGGGGRVGEGLEAGPILDPPGPLTTTSQVERLV